MTSINIVALINLVGFVVGAALYAMLLVMVVLSPARKLRAGKLEFRAAEFGSSVNGLLAATAVLGSLWNVGALATYGVKDFGVDEPLPFVTALSFTALGFLPAVVVHSVLRAQASARTAPWIGVVAYVLSTTAGIMHFYSAAAVNTGHSNAALMMLTVGYLAVILALVLTTRRQPGSRWAVCASALAVFAVSALHLSQHSHSGPETWSIQLLGHHASLPLVLAILYQDYRFAFADIFLKRALAFVMLIAVVFTSYLFVAAPLLLSRSGRVQLEPVTIAALLGLWVLTALLYPELRRAAIWFVDSVILRRADYMEVKARLTQVFAEAEDAETVLKEVCQALGPALTAAKVSWSVTGNSEPLGKHTDGAASEPEFWSKQPDRLVLRVEPWSDGGALVYIPTSEPPYYQLSIGELAGGRRLLSDDIDMLETVALMAARRIDFLRVAHERCEQVSREQEISKLATEAQLRALRAQLNPHFLFNALTTIGYLIKAAPNRALDTLIKLTDLLRRVLSSNDDSVTLGEELKLIASYLDIEKERFEARLRVHLDVPPDLLSISLPPLLIQPLVENAIKHGIGKSRFGGEVTVAASLEPAHENASDTKRMVLRVKVSDTGVGASEAEMARQGRRGLGLGNIEERLRCYYGAAAQLQLQSTPGKGTTAEVIIPVAMVGGGENGESRPAMAGGRS